MEYKRNNQRAGKIPGATERRHTLEIRVVQDTSAWCGIQKGRGA